MIKQIENLIRKRILQKAFPVLAKITKIYSLSDQYFIDCKELTNMEEETNTLYTRVPLPKYWGTDQGGIWMMPSVGATALISFLNGDRNFPIITNIMGSSHSESFKENNLLIKIGNTQFSIENGKTIIDSGNSSIIVSDKISIENNAAKLKEILEDILNDLPQVTCSKEGKPGLVMPSATSSSIQTKINMLLQ